MESCERRMCSLLHNQSSQNCAVFRARLSTRQDDGSFDVAFANFISQQLLSLLAMKGKTNDLGCTYKERGPREKIERFGSRKREHNGTAQLPRKVVWSLEGSGSALS